MSKRIGMLALVCLTAFSTGGCIGRMAVTGKVRDFNLDVAQNRWLREGVFLALYIVPAYPIAGVADLIIVNSIEFHTGINPVSGERRLARVGEVRRVEAENGTTSVSTLREDGSIDLAVTEADGTRHFVNLGADGGRVVARDEAGRELASVPRGAELPPRPHRWPGPEAPPGR